MSGGGADEAYLQVILNDLFCAGTLFQTYIPMLETGYLSSNYSLFLCGGGIFAKGNFSVLMRWLFPLLFIFPSL
jgi:hypothetical protein